MGPQRNTKHAAKSKMSLTKRSVAGISPATKEQWVYDASTPRLAVRVTPAGGKSWVWVGKLHGRLLRLKIGDCAEVTPENARKMAVAISADVIAGIDPRDEKRDARAELTFSELFIRFIEEHAKPRKVTWFEDEKQYNRYLTKWRSKRISAIVKADVLALHKSVGEDSGRVAANRLLSLVSKVFSFANDIGYALTNPAKGVKKYPEESRDRFLNGDELKRFFEALKKESQLMQDFFTLLLIIGCRRGNLMKMRFDEIDFGAMTWRMPRTKSGKALIVPLVDEAVEILQRRLDESEGFPYVFRGGKKNNSGHLQDPGFAWDRVRKNSKLEDVHLHDLRRSVASWMVASGASLPMVGRLLGHSQASTTMIYARLDVSGIRGSVQTAVGAMLAVGKPTPAEGDKPAE